MNFQRQAAPLFLALPTKDKAVMEPSGNSVLVQASVLAGAGGVVGGRAGHASPSPVALPSLPGPLGRPLCRLSPASASCSGRHPPSSPTCSVASGTSPPPPALQNSFCHPDAFLTNLPGITSVSFLLLSAAM